MSSTNFKLGTSSNEDDILEWKKLFRAQEAEWKKEKALMEQQIEILNLQNREFHEREQSVNQMNKSVMKALNDFTRDNDSSQNKELKERNNELDTKYNSAVLRYEKNEIAIQQKLHHLENEKKNMTIMLKLYEDEKKQVKEKEAAEYELHSKIGELRYLVEKQKEEHQKELEKVHNEYNTTIKNLKKLAETEKNSLELQVNRLQESQRSENKSIEEIRKSYNEEMTVLRKERDEANNRVEQLEPQIKKFQEIIKGLESKFSDMRLLEEVEEKKLKAKFMEQESNLKKSQQVEKLLRQALADKEHEIEAVKLEYRKKLNDEKKRVDQAHELAKKYKEEGDRRNNLIVQESLRREETIKSLKKQLSDIEISSKTSLDNFQNESSINQSLQSSINSSKPKPGASISSIKKNYMQRVSNGSKGMWKSGDMTNKINEKPKNDLGSSQRSIQFDDTFEGEEDIINTTSENILKSLSSPKNNTSKGKLHKIPLNTQKTSPNLSRVRASHDQRSLDLSSSRRSEQYPRSQSNENNRSKDLKDLNRKNSLAGNQNEKVKTVDVPYFFGSENIKSLPKIRENSRTSPENTSNEKSNQLGISSINEFVQAWRDICTDQGKEVPVNPNPSDILLQLTVDLEKNKKLLKNLEEKYDKVTLEKEKLQLELDRCILELKQTKMEWALSEEKKEESELALKNEIKYLINKLLQVKTNSLSSAGSPRSDSQIFTYNPAVSKSTLDLHASFLNSPLVQLTPTENNLEKSIHKHIPDTIKYEAQLNSSHNDTKTFENSIGLRKINQNLNQVFEHTEFKENKPMNKNQADIKDKFQDSPNRRVSEFSNQEKSNKMQNLKETSNPGQKKLIQFLKK